MMTVFHLHYAQIYYLTKLSDNNDIDTETVNIIVDYSDEANTLFAKIANPANKSEIERGEKLVFKGDAAGGTPPYTYLWDFDDESINIIRDQNPGEVRFHNIGSYKVKLVVTDSNSKTSKDELIVCVSNEDCKLDPPTGLSVSANN